MAPRRGASAAPQGLTRRLRRRPAACALALWAALAACGPDAKTPAPTAQPPGVTFTYPRDGQLDVPTASRLIFQLTGEVNEAALREGCTATGSTVQGSFCVVGPSGPVEVTPTVLGPRGNIIVASAAGLLPGERYQVYLRPTLLADAANLPAEAPLVSFRTRQAQTAAGAPRLLAVGGEDPAAFTAGGPAPRHPVLDRASLRLVFSEALDERTALAAGAVTLRRAGTTAALPATVLAVGQHLVVDPDADLDAGARHELVLTGLTDRGGTALPATTLSFSPVSGPSYEQVVALDLPDAGASPELSELTGAPINSVHKHAPLIGSAELSLLPGTLRAELGDPTAFGGPIPFTVRKGQRLSASELPLRLAGVVGLGYQTGPLRFDLLSDANGWVTRNPHRPADVRPDDRDAPLMVELFLDAALTAEDATGNALATQTLLGMHLVGLATVAQGQLALEATGAIEVELLGVTRSHADLSLRLRTGATAVIPNEAPPRVVATSPARGDTQVATDARLQVLLSSAVDAGKLRAAGQLALMAGTTSIAVDARVAGAAVVITPRQPLAPATAYSLRLGPMVDAAGQPLTLSPGDPTAGTGVIPFTTAAAPGGATVPPQLAAVVPGAPCALTGGSATSPGRCVAGRATDLPYRPFELTADRDIEAWFTQPMSAASLRVGAACNTGAIRVEQLDGAGACVQAVPGELTVRQAGFRFTPLTRWIPGARYRVTMIAGTDATCNAGEVCGANGRPLNTDALADADSEGGAAVVLPFTAASPAPTTMIPLTALPLADRNGNGYLDAGEILHPDNQLAVDVVSTSGDVTAAALAGPDCKPALLGNQVCIGVAAALPVTVLPKVESCPITPTGAPATGAGPCVPVRISAQSVRVTSLTINATAKIGIVEIDIRNVQTGLMHLRLLEPTAAGAVGYILDDGNGKPMFVIAVQTLMDAPDLSIPLVDHDVQSKPVNLVLTGPVTFLPDGRMRVELHNRGNVIIPVHITAPLVDGYINLRVPDGTLSLSLVTPAIR
ncbi:MAG: Ig-like domain-containing protein [Myxococcales bacterium]|nr:Ig-like domain-containing protein [Myxococcales bacterium]